MPDLLNDHPTLWDGLQRNELLYEVAREIVDGATPQVIGIYGDWGSGKTSFLRQLQFVLSYEAPDAQIWEAIRPDDRPERQGKSDEEYQKILIPKLYNQILGTHTPLIPVPVVWFDAWHYQSEAAPVVALLHEIRRQFSSGQRFWNAIRKGTKNARDAALFAIEPIGEAIEPRQTGAKAIAKAVGGWSGIVAKNETASLETELSSEQIRRLLSHSVRQIVRTIDYPAVLRAVGFGQNDGPESPKMKRRMVVIIDDLDRCEPEMAVKLLEGIKVFMSLEHCVFVLGLNEHRLVDHVASLQKDYGKETVDPCRHRAKDYLDKIVSRHYSLGIAFDRQGLIGRHLEGFKLKQDAEEARVEEVREILKGPYLLPPNPRKIKGFLATLRRYCTVEFPTEPDARLLILFAYLNQFHPRIVRKMAYYPEYAVDFFNWAADKGLLSNKTFDGLLPAPSQTTAAEDSLRYHDPINDNLFHAHVLAVEWWKEHEPNLTPDPAQPAGDHNKAGGLAEVLRPYILLA